MAQAITLSGQDVGGSSATIYTVPSGKRLIMNFRAEASGVAGASFRVGSFEAAQNNESAASTSPIVLGPGETISYTLADGGDTVSYLVSGFLEDDV